MANKKTLDELIREVLSEATGESFVAPLSKDASV